MCSLSFTDGHWSSPVCIIPLLAFVQAPTPVDCLLISALNVTEFSLNSPVCTCPSVIDSLNSLNHRCDLYHGRSCRPLQRLWTTLISPLLWTRAKATNADVNTESLVLPVNAPPVLLGEGIAGCALPRDAVPRVLAKLPAHGYSEGPNPAGLTAPDVLVGESEIHRSYRRTRRRH